jgi:hypothetical protein
MIGNTIGTISGMRTKVKLSFEDAEMTIKDLRTQEINLR